MTIPSQSPEFRLHISHTELTEELDHLVSRLLAQEAIPGLALALVREGDVVWERGWGRAHAATDRPMTAQSRLEAASLAKPLTAYLALLLAAEGVLGLDSPLVSYLPAENPPGVHPEDPRWRQITLRHVLSHTSGLSHSDPPVILTPPGEGFRYCLGGFALLQRVLEHCTGLDFDQLAKERIFQPFGMSHSSFLPPQVFNEHSPNEHSPDEQIACGHDAQGRPLPPAKTPRPRAWNSLWTSAQDYARFLAHISVEGQNGHLGHSWRAMLQPQVKINDELSWTLGWGLQEGLSGPILWHWGGPRGGRHYVAFSPDHQFALVLLVNSAIGDQIWSQVVAAAMGGHHPVLPWGGSLWWRADRQRELIRVESIQRRHDTFAAALTKTLCEQTGTPLRVEASFTELAPYAECVLMASRFATCGVRLKMGPEKLDAVLNLPVAVLRGLLGGTNPEKATPRPDGAELRQLKPMAHLVARDLAAAWESEEAFDSIELEVDPKAVGLAKANETILLLGFRVVPAAEASSAEAQPAKQRYQLAFTVGYPLSRL